MLLNVAPVFRFSNPVKNKIRRTLIIKTAYIKRKTEELYYTAVKVQLSHRFKQHCNTTEIK